MLVLTTLICTTIGNKFLSTTLCVMPTVYNNFQCAYVCWPSITFIVRNTAEVHTGFYILHTQRHIIAHFIARHVKLYRAAVSNTVFANA